MALPKRLLLNGWKDRASRGIARINDLKRGYLYSFSHQGGAADVLGYIKLYVARIIT